MLTSVPAKAETPREPPKALRVVGSSEACPSPAQLIRQLRSLLPETKLRAASEEPTSDDATIEDQGESFIVSVAGQSRTFSDPERQCADRARHGAVFIALVLDPLKFPSEEAPPEERSAAKPKADEQRKPPPTRPKSPAENEDEGEDEDEDESRGSKRGPSLTLELGPQLQLAPTSGSRNLPVAGGAGARVSWGSTLSLSLGVAAFYPTTLDFSQGSARVLWVPFDISARLNARHGPWEIAGEVGPVAALLSAKGQRVEGARGDTRLDVGARAATGVRYWAGERNAIFLAGHATVFPRPYALQVEGLGQVGKTPALWLGASVGMVIKLD